MPLLLPLLLVITLAVRLTSRGPAFFLQMRVGRHGRAFTILKFRTMIHSTDKAHHAISTVSNQEFTLIGPLLRRWKLDELPQLLNVLWGDMSLVGPRPKMPEHMIGDLPCRPGITGGATIVFAHEEAILDRVPKHQLDTCYQTIILPAKRQLDSEYMARATFFSDLKLIVNSVLRRWDTSAVIRLLNIEAFEEADRADRTMLSISSDPGVASLSNRDDVDSVACLTKPSRPFFCSTPCRSSFAPTTRCNARAPCPPARAFPRRPFTFS
jgi:lipopolysaccharide/colanic/teichoic acid biosynthesis glycosyltransferase